MVDIKELVADIEEELKAALHVPREAYIRKGDDVTDDSLCGRTRIVINGVPYVTEDWADHLARLSWYKAVAEVGWRTRKGMDSSQACSEVVDLNPPNPGERKMAEAEAQHGMHPSGDPIAAAFEAIPELRPELAFDDPASHPAVLRMMAKRLDAMQKQADAHEDRVYQHGKRLDETQKATQALPQWVHAEQRLENGQKQLNDRCNENEDGVRQLASNMGKLESLGNIAAANLREHIDATKRATDSLANAMTDAENRLNAERMKDLIAVNTDLLRLERRIEELDQTTKPESVAEPLLPKLANWGGRLKSIEVELLNQSNRITAVYSADLNDHKRRISKLEEAAKVCPYGALVLNRTDVSPSGQKEEKDR
jgi:hypothetical protein